MKKLIIILFVFSIALYSQISSANAISWIKLVAGSSVYTSDMGTYSFNQNGDIILDGGKILKFVGAKTSTMAFYTYDENLSDMYMQAPSIMSKMVEGYAVSGTTLQSAVGLLDSYNERLDLWMEENATYDDYNTGWIVNENANWKTYPVPLVGDIDWSTLQNIGSLTR